MTIGTASGTCEARLVKKKNLIKRVADCFQPRQEFVSADQIRIKPEDSARQAGLCLGQCGECRVLRRDRPRLPRCFWHGRRCARGFWKRPSDSNSEAPRRAFS